jgi:hypothetical protein
VRLRRLRARDGFGESHLVALNFAFGVIFKISVALVPPFYNLAELVCERGVEEVVHA